MQNRSSSALRTRDLSLNASSRTALESDPLTSFRVTNQPLMLTNYIMTGSDVLTSFFDGLTARAVEEIKLLERYCSLFWPASAHLDNSCCCFYMPFRGRVS